MADPLAYFITFRTYGTWLPGDGREYVDRRSNAFDSPFLASDSFREQRARTALRTVPFVLDDRMREHVAEAVVETCELRGWTLSALNVRTNHVRTVVSAGKTPERVMNDLKAYATRRLVATGAVRQGRPVWSRHGSTVWLFTQDEFERACIYTLEGQ